MNINFTTNDLKLKMETMLDKKLFIFNIADKEFITDENQNFIICIDQDGLINLNDGEKIFDNILDFYDYIGNLNNYNNIDNNNNNSNINDQENIDKLIQFLNKTNNYFLFKGGLIPVSIEPTGIWGLEACRSCDDYSETGYNKEGFINEGLAKENKDFSFEAYEGDFCELCDYNTENGCTNNDLKDNDEDDEYYCPGFWGPNFNSGREGHMRAKIEYFLNKFENNFVESGIHGDCFIFFFETGSCGRDGGDKYKYYKLHKCKTIKEFMEFNFDEFYKKFIEYVSLPIKEKQAKDYIQDKYSISYNEIIEYFKELNK